MPKGPYKQYNPNRDKFTELMIRYQEALRKIPTMEEFANAFGMEKPRLYENMNKKKKA